MKELIAFITILAFSGFSQETPTTMAAQAPQLYLHFLTPGVGNGGQTLKYLRTLTTKISLGEDFDVRVDDGAEYISGRIENRDGKMFAHLRSYYISCSYNYDGFIEPEKKYDAGNGGMAFSSVIFLANFVVSTNAGCQPFVLAKTEPNDVAWQTSSIADSFYRTIVSTNTGQYAVVDSSKEAVTLYDKADHMIWTTNVVMGLQSDPVMGERKISGMRVYKGDLWVNVGRGYAIVTIKTGGLKGFAQR
jgi:hypothetical protein